MIRRIIQIDEEKCNGCGACAAEMLLIPKESLHYKNPLCLKGAADFCLRVAVAGDWSPVHITCS